jgi:RimJ/RimL family protein N-acetyltransferase
VPAITAGCQDPAIARFTMVPTPYATEHARGFVADAAGRRERGETIDLAIAARDAPDRLLGVVGLLRFEDERRRAEIGYWLAAEARGRGLTTRAVTLLSRWALRPPLDLRRLELIPDVENVASCRVAERAGFTREGVLREWVEAKGRVWTVTVYALLRADAEPLGNG